LRNLRSAILRGCGLAVTPEMTIGHRARQVFDLSAPAPLLVTEHRAHDCCCAGCGARIGAVLRRAEPGTIFSCASWPASWFISTRTNVLNWLPRGATKGLSGLDLLILALVSVIELAVRLAD
jgi:hypothetical protein